MPNVGITELLVVLAIALLVIGPKRIPELGRSLGRMIREFRRASSSVQEELGLDEVRDDVQEIRQSAQKVTGSMNVRSHLGLDELEPIKMDVVDAAAAAQASEAADHSKTSAPPSSDDAGEDRTSAAAAAGTGDASSDEAPPDTPASSPVKTPSSADEADGPKVAAS